MMFVRRPITHSLFEPSIATPNIAYWVLHPSSSENKQDEKTTIASNQKQDDNTSAATPKGNNNNDDDDKPTPTKSWSRFLLDDFEVFDEEGQVALSTELPGVKHADLKVEFHDSSLQVEGTRKRGTKKQSFVRRLAMDEDLIDVENIAATLEDGILTVKAPKVPKEQENQGNENRHKVVVSKASPPEEDSTTEPAAVAALNLEIDLPGVKADALNVVVSKNGLLNVVAERKHSGTTGNNNKSSQQPTTKRFSEAFRLNTRKVDVHKLEAYLNDGVLTIRAPAKIHKTKIVLVNGQLPLSPSENATEEEENKAAEKEKKKEE